MVRDLRKLKAAKHLREEVFFSCWLTQQNNNNAPHSTPHLRTPVWCFENPLQDNKYKTMQIEDVYSSFPPLLHLSKIKNIKEVIELTNSVNEQEHQMRKMHQQCKHLKKLAKVDELWGLSDEKLNLEYLQEQNACEREISNQKNVIAHLEQERFYFFSSILFFFIIKFLSLFLLSPIFFLSCGFSNNNK